MIRRPLLALATGTALVGAGLAVPAEAATPTVVARGTINAASLNTFTQRLTVTGWAFDPRHTSSSIVVKFYVSGRYVGRALADRPSTATNTKLGISGRHGYTFTVTRTVATASIAARSGGIVTEGPRSDVGTRTVSRYTPPAGERIVSVAKRYVGKARYVDGGASPQAGFDCSGYTQYVYAQAKVASLPHNAAAQKSVRGMRSVSASNARPGDLVFYHGGGGIYHVAVYAGGHMQYAAATPRDGIRYQAIWSSAVSYGHLG